MIVKLYGKENFKYSKLSKRKFKKENQDFFFFFLRLNNFILRNQSRIEQWPDHKV